MILVCKPKGRGNWAPIKIEINDQAPGHGSSRVTPLLFHIGQMFALGGVVLRVHLIYP